MADNNAEYVPKTDSEMVKGWGGWNNFMASYGLKPYNDDDVDEAHRILEGFREQDKLDWEEQQNAQKK